MTDRRPTLKRIAEAAGVHVSTASRALDPGRRHLIADNVVRAIEAAAASLGYVRDTQAAALRTGRSMLIGVIVPDVANPVFGPILQGVEAAISAAGYSAIVANAGTEDDRAGRAADSLIARRVDGLVSASAALTDDMVSRCLQRRIPLVLVNRAEAMPRTYTVVPDDAAGLRLAIDHLVGLGHRVIGHIAGPQHVSTGLWRLDGFRHAIRDLGLPDGPVAVASAYNRSAGEVAAANLLAETPVTAIAAANDLLALGAYAAIRARGLRCPEDVSIVGYNDMPLIDIVEPPLSTVRIQSDALGRRAGEILLQAMLGDTPPPIVERIAPTLIVRQSTAPPSKAARL